MNEMQEQIPAGRPSSMRWLRTLKRHALWVTFNASLVLIIAFAYVYLFRGESGKTVSQTAENAKAVIMKAYKDVHIKSENSLDWSKAQLQGKLYNGDTIRTASNSNVSIVIDKDTDMEIGEDSLIQFSNKVILKDGVFTLKVGSSGDGIAISTPDGDLVIAPKREVALWVAGSGNMPFAESKTANKVMIQVRVSEKQPTKIQVISGSAEVKKDIGPAISLNSGDSLDVDKQEIKIVSNEAGGKNGSVFKPQPRVVMGLDKIDSLSTPPPPPKLEVGEVIWE